MRTTINAIDARLQFNRPTPRISGTQQQAKRRCCGSAACVALGHAADNEDSSDHLIRPGQDLVGDGEAKSPSGLEVDDEFKGCRLFHRHVGRLGTL